MPVYISLLRGINVGGNKIILMDDLAELFEKLEFSEVRTYIQSGNVVFAYRKKTASQLEEMIKAAVKTQFKFDIEVLVLNLEDLGDIIEENPFKGNKPKAGERIYLTILSQTPLSEKVAELRKIKSPNDDFEIIGRTVYVLCRKGYAKSVFNNNSIEKTLKVLATSRNLETMKKLVEIGKAID
ncbi:MAG TPA: DUF1697 domain-containing protein [Candidatus Acidoferrales bacterium]|nr:DUF1697 domain-containing protein [Candidatus Acidoferrales bacterium]